MRGGEKLAIKIVYCNLFYSYTTIFTLIVISWTVFYHDRYYLNPLEHTRELCL